MPVPTPHLCVPGVGISVHGQERWLYTGAIFAFDCSFWRHLCCLRSRTCIRLYDVEMVPDVLVQVTGLVEATHDGLV